MKSVTLIALAFALGMVATPARAQAPAAVDPLEAEGLEQSGTVITIIFDDSGSMEGSKLKQAKTAFRQWIAGVPATYRLGLVALNAGPLVPLGRDNRPALLKAVEQIRSSRGTPLAATIRSALADIERRRGIVGPYERHIMLVFTDGEDSTMEGVMGVQSALARASSLGIETVGIGYHGEGSYMRTAATRYYEAKNLKELESSLARVDAEIGDTSDIVIDERTRAAMEGASIDVEPPPLNDSPPPPAPKKKSGNKGFPFHVNFMYIIIAWAVVRAIVKRKVR